MCNFMDDINEQEIFAVQDGTDDECQARVLHGNNRKGWGQEDNIVPGMEAGRGSGQMGTG